MGIITKAPLIERDIDVLQQLAREAQRQRSVSIPFHDPELARAIEPGVATPAAAAPDHRAAGRRPGIPVGVNVAPIIPGLSDEDIAEVLEAARERRRPAAPATSCCGCPAR